MKTLLLTVLLGLAGCNQNHAPYVKDAAGKTNAFYRETVLVTRTNGCTISKLEIDAESSPTLYVSSCPESLHWEESSGKTTTGYAVLVEKETLKQKAMSKLIDEEKKALGLL